MGHDVEERAFWRGQSGRARQALVEQGGVIAAKLDTTANAFAEAGNRKLAARARQAAAGARNTGRMLEAYQRELNASEDTNKGEMN